MCIHAGQISCSSPPTIRELSIVTGLKCLSRHSQATTGVLHAQCNPEEVGYLSKVTFLGTTPSQMGGVGHAIAIDNIGIKMLCHVMKI